MVKITKNYLMVLFISAVFLFAINSVFAWGISSPYWDNNPMQLHPGEKTTAYFRLFNCPWLGEECEQRDITVYTQLVEGRQISRIQGKYFTIPFGSPVTGEIVEIPVTVKAPKNSRPGDSYYVRFYIYEKDPSGMISVGYNIGFPVNVV